MPGGGMTTVWDGCVGLPHAAASNAPVNAEAIGRTRAIVVGSLTIRADAA